MNLSFLLLFGRIVQSAVSVIINSPSQKGVGFGGRSFCPKRPRLFEFAADGGQFFDSAASHLVGLVNLAGGDSLLPKHVAARFGSHARSHIQLMLEQTA